jgi:RNA polymerase subunit RPABC4/transcription elongation factor Spt4
MLTMTDEKEKLTEGMRIIRWRMAHENFRFRDEIRIIPRGVFYFGVLIIVLGQAIAWVAYTLAPPQDMTRWGAVGIAAGAAVALDLALLFFAYVNRDAKRRGMNATLWTLLAIVVPYLIGVIIYFLLREPLPYNCPQCGATVSARFNFCPNCKTNLRPACPQCKREIRIGNKFCPYCGGELEPVA